MVRRAARTSTRRDERSGSPAGRGTSLRRSRATPAPLKRCGRPWLARLCKAAATPFLGRGVRDEGMDVCHENASAGGFGGVGLLVGRCRGAGGCRAGVTGGGRRWLDRLRVGFQRRWCGRHWDGRRAAGQADAGGRTGARCRAGDRRIPVQRRVARRRHGVDLGRQRVRDVGGREHRTVSHDAGAGAWSATDRPGRRRRDQRLGRRRGRLGLGLGRQQVRAAGRRNTGRPVAAGAGADQPGDPGRRRGVQFQHGPPVGWHGVDLGQERPW